MAVNISVENHLNWTMNLINNYTYIYIIQYTIIQENLWSSHSVQGHSSQNKVISRKISRDEIGGTFEPDVRVQRSLKKKRSITDKSNCF